MNKNENGNKSGDQYEPSTPLMKQYQSIKDRHADAILFFRLGDFYEMFGEDARIASRILQITLTTRDKGSENPLPMCGIPHFAAENYIARLIREGYKVAICEQIEDAQNAKGIVNREVVRVITPGTHEPENPKESSYISAIFPLNSSCGIATAELSTGEFIILESSDQLEDQLALIKPREIIIPASLIDNIYYSEVLRDYYVTSVDDYSFDYTESYRLLLDHFKVSSLEGFGCEGMQAGIAAGGALLSYLIETQKNILGFRRISTINTSNYMILDSVTQKNLEILSNLRDGGIDGSLLKVLDETLTPMGGRFLRGALVRPLTSLSEITLRLDAVEAFVDNFELTENLRFILRNVHDIERLSVRLSTSRANARDLVSIKNSVSLFPKLCNSLKAENDPLLTSIAADLGDFSDLRNLIERAIVDTPPLSIKDGGIIRRGYHEEADELKALSTNSRAFLSDFELDERERTGINSLKVGYNKVYGYYIEITKTNLNLVPDHYIRKQTLVNAERFVTEELKEYESRILGAEEKLKKLEVHLFERILETVAPRSEALKKTASVIALLDFLLSLATISRRYDYSKPIIDDSGTVQIVEGRHPVLERISRDERFVPNNVSMDTDGNYLLIITGPNMAGKSTYMRQTALIILMAQIGSFVPALSARIGLVDRIFTRIGASDYLSFGQSTFMVEMIETSNIMNNSTSKSFIILDEVGRGTSTFDGISIAWAVAEYIATRIRARTMFATHYNELTDLSVSVEGTRNLNIAVREWGDEIIFLRKIENGPADKSYGIQVARLAGLPEGILVRAKEILAGLEDQELRDPGPHGILSSRLRKKAEQLDLFGARAHPALIELEKVKIDDLPPEEAVTILNRLKEMMRENN